MKYCELNIYTANAVLSFNVRVTAKDFSAQLAQALEEGTVLLETDEGNTLLLCAVNVVAVEIGREFDKDTPPR